MAAQRGVPRRAAARGQRQDLQAPLARPVLAERRAQDLRGGAWASGCNPMNTSPSRCESASRALLACTVVIEPSWPVFMACSMSSASPPRTSPMMTRSGRMRRLFLTSARCEISPLPSTLGGRVSSRTTCCCCNCNSAASSMVTTRSEGGMKPDIILSSVVFPLPLGPTISVLAN